MDLCGFKLLRCDRNELSGKQNGGGVALYINEKWCTNITVKESTCTKDYESIIVSLRPFYLPREFSNIFVTVLYIPPDANRETAVHYVRELSTTLSADKPDALQIIMGDMNHCVSQLNKTLRNFEQCVKQNTRGQQLLDTFYCSEKQAYRSFRLSPLANSDHNMLHLMPVYISRLKRTKPVKITKHVLDDSSQEKLNTCFDLTNWDLFVHDCGGDVNALTDVVTDYITFCKELHLITKEITTYPNNKPWITSELRNSILEKHRAYGTECYHDKQQIVKSQIEQAKTKYKNKVEDLFKTKNSRDAWRGLKVLTGTEKNNKEPAILSEHGAADRLNKFYACFDTVDFSKEQDEIKNHLRSSLNLFIPLEISEASISKTLNKIQVKKAGGPDNLSAKLIKSCKDSLLYIIHKIFQLSLSSCTFPSSWKIGEIIPVSKKDLPRVDNDLRPVTLTAVLSKCLERVSLELLFPFVKDHIDPLQFAYLQGRSTCDATCTMLHSITSHLDATTSNTVRTLFIDYSSAFNTIQPHILINKLEKIGVPPNFLLWILDYLTCRPQYVRTKQETSSHITLNTGAPQGCVLSPVLFIMYTNDLRWHSDTVRIFKYADDTAVVGLIKNSDDNEYFKCIDFVNNWCKEHFLKLNVTKTKEIVLDFRRRSCDTVPVTIDDNCVECVDSYKYLGLLMDDKLTFSYHVDCQLKKANKRLYCIRTMKKLNVNPSIIALFYNMTVPPVLMYSAITFYGIISVLLKKELDHPRKICARIVKECCDMLHSNDGCMAMLC